MKHHREITQGNEITEVWRAWEDVLLQEGIRMTPQRQAILQYLAGVRTHPTAQEVYEAVRVQYPHIARATVYNTLNLLARLGLILELRREGGAVRYETDTTPHVNLICLQCGKVVDAHVPISLETDEEALDGFQILHIRVDAYGYCAECRSQGLGSAGQEGGE